MSRLPVRDGVITKLDSVSFDQLLRAQEPFGEGNAVFDLTGIRLVTPSALVQLAAASYALSLTGIRPVIVLEDESVRSYLARAGFVSVIEPVADVESPVLTPLVYMYDRLRGSNPMLIEATKIENGRKMVPATRFIHKSSSVVVSGPVHRDLAKSLKLTKSREKC